MAQPNRTYGAGLIYIGAFVLIIIFPATLFMIFRHPAHADHCPISSSGEMIPNRTIDGVLVFSSDSIFAQSYDGKQHVRKYLAGCQPKGGCTGPFRELENDIGKPVHAEFCGASLIRVALTEREVFKSVPATQEQLDAANLTGKKVGLGMMFFPFCLIFWGIFRLRRKRLEGQALQ
jgi:hypothetical protein